MSSDIDRSSFDWGWREALWLGLAMLVVLCVAFAPFVFGDRSLMSSARETASLFGTGARDQVMQSPRVLDPGAPAWTVDPWMALEHRIIFEEHRLPVWDPYDGYGTPLLAAMQPQPFYPLTFALVAHHSPRAYTWWVLGRLFICGWFAALFMRLFAGRWAALTTGISAMLSGYYLLYYDMPHLSVDTGFPMLLWATEIACRRATPARIAALGLATGLTYLGGMPESAVLAIGTAALFGFVRVLYSERRLLMAGTLVGGNLIGLALGAIMIVPFAEFEGQSFNLHDPAIIGAVTGLAFDGSWVHGLLTELVPRAIGDPLISVLPGAGYTGIRGFSGCVIFALALLGVLSFRSAPKSLRIVIGVMTAIVVFEVLKRFGNPLVNWTGALPLARLVIFPKYMEFVFGDCVAVLAGLGVRFLGSVTPPQRSVVAAFALVFAALTYLYDRVAPEVANGAGFAVLDRGVAIGLVALFAAFAVTYWLLSLPVERRERLLGILPALVLTEILAAYIVPMLWPAPSIDENPWLGAPFVSFLQTNVVPQRDRVFATGEDFFPNWPGAFGLADPRNLNAIYPADYLPFVNTFLTQLAPDGQDRFVGTGAIAFASPLVQRWLKLSSIAFVVESTRGPLNPPFGDRTPAFASPGAAVFQSAHALPRFALFHRAQSAPTLASALTVLRDPRFDIDTEAVVQGLAPKLEPKRGAETVRIDLNRSDSVTATVVVQSDALLVQNDTWYPGWIALLDGQRVPIERVNGIFRGIAIPSGRHVLELDYEPASVRLGLRLSLTGLATIVALLCLSGLADLRRLATNA